MGCGASKEGPEASQGEPAPRPGNLRTNAILIPPPSESADENAGHVLGHVGEFLTDVGTAISHAVDELGQVGMHAFAVYSMHRRRCCSSCRRSSASHASGPAHLTAEGGQYSRPTTAPARACASVSVVITSACVNAGGGRGLDRCGLRGSVNQSGAGSESAFRSSRRGSAASPAIRRTAAAQRGGGTRSAARVRVAARRKSSKEVEQDTRFSCATLAREAPVQRPPAQQGRAGQVALGHCEREDYGVPHPAPADLRASPTHTCTHASSLSHTHTRARARMHAQHVHVSLQGAFESEAQRQEHLWCELGGEALAPSLRSGAIKLLRAEWLVHPARPPLHTIPRGTPLPW